MLLSYFMITPERLTAFLMKQIVRIALLLMLIGMIFIMLKINIMPAEIQVSSEFVQKESHILYNSFFFNIATVLLLITPVIISLCTGILFAAKKQFMLAIISFMLFMILSISIIIHMLIV